MLKDLEFPDLEPDRKKKRGLSVASDGPDAAPAAIEPEQRFVSVDGDGADIDVAQFPALRAALGLTGDITEAPTDDIVEEAEPFEEPEPEEAVPEEEPVPSLFAGIGRTDWSTPAKKPKTESSADDEALPLEEIEAEPDEDEPEDEEQKEPEISEFDLLDMIDDIEFSDLGPEALKPMQFRQLITDPYNSSFNSVGDDADEREPDEMPVSPKFIFEKK